MEEEQPNSPSKSKDTSSVVSGESTEDSLQGDELVTSGRLPPDLPEEPEPMDSELEIMDLVPWETAVKQQDTEFDFSALSSRTFQIILFSTSLVSLASICKVYNVCAIETQVDWWKWTCWGYFYNKNLPHHVHPVIADFVDDR